MATPGSSMRRIALRSLRAHKLRFLLTLLSVFLGTSFVAGSFILTNSLSRVFDSLFNQQLASVEVVVSPPGGADSPSAAQGTAEQPTGPEYQSRVLPLSILDELRSQPGVAAANIYDEHSVVVADDDKTALQSGGAPMFVAPYYPDSEQAASPPTILQGHEPHGRGEVLINAEAAESNDISLGESLTLVDRASRYEVVVVGTYESQTQVGSSVGVYMDAPAFTDIWSGGSINGSVFLRANEGTDPDTLLDEIQARYPQYKVTTGQELADELSDSVAEALSFVNYFLVAFGLVALLVGTFIIANTFAMIVAQRLREFALLRSLGVSQRQITVSVVFEAVVVGILGSLLGVAGGAGLVTVTTAVMEATGVGPGNSEIILSTEAVLIPVALGTLVTVASAWAPARRAGAVKPVEAMRSGDTSSSSSLLIRTLIGFVVLGLAIGLALLAALLWQDWETRSRAIAVGAAAVGLIGGTFLVAAALSLVVVPLIGRVIGLPFGAVGRLAATNSQRNPRRTATTAFALTLGVALVTSFGMLGATMKSTVSDLIESSVGSDYLITGAASADGTFPLPQDTVDAAVATSGVKSVATQGAIPITVDGESGLSASIPNVAKVSFFYSGDLSTAAGLEVAEGTADADTPGVIVDKKVAAQRGWTVGQEVELQIAGTPLTSTVPVIGLYEPNTLLGAHLITSAALDKFGAEVPASAALNQRAVLVIFVIADGNNTGAGSTEELRTNLEAAMKPFIVAQVVTPQEYAGQEAMMIDQMLGILYALLGLSIVVAVLGIINTLALNVIERRQEIGMLRSLGTHRGQIRRLITLEAVQIALFGAVVGVAVGLFLGWAFISVLANDGLGSASYPWSTIIGMLVGSAVVGIIAAVWPAIKASRTPPLDAIKD